MTQNNNQVRKKTRNDIDSPSRYQGFSKFSFKMVFVDYVLLKVWVLSHEILSQRFFSNVSNS